jgi:integration host factor subunit beta
MVRSDLVARVADLNPHLSPKQADAVVSAILNRISDALLAGGRVELRGLGIFTVKDRPARVCRGRVRQ